MKEKRPTLCIVAGPNGSGKTSTTEQFDLLIGASAVANDLILVTENVKHLERIPHLKIENWIDRAKI
ncbi:hypothetical protein GKD20_20440 [Parabacteroides distasonis]|uniref:UDP-N-acetylglucosamine kinase n=1 Tax=Parabacteroides distasonis TaxID=823 RepID=A0A7K0HPP9_PARDI|nr:hypothetical protein [Parabacteroides distasonis]MRY45363.1 hypothetical protein [Parabacteroides distasonis]MRZ46538.1 hypothetical protein [Parabacteroides distasonis]MRZ52111.1 hypothetical protein [Parabacteroides distasonis]MRZ74330.1 hypothetical protein [Parabacteroides distasonis]